MRLFSKIKARQIHLFGILGIDLVRIITILRYVRRFIGEVSEFRKLGGEVSEFWPILHDYNTFGGTSDGHYFHQDLLVANYIHKRNPRKHVDIGSRVDGFVAHVATFREILVLDINETPVTNHENITFKKLDIMNPSTLFNTDSLSCLHALEHFGLGRYGDSLDPQGHLVGLKNMIAMLDFDGIFYVSFPISQNPKVVFNAHRIFHPRAILEWIGDELALINFDYVNDSGLLIKSVDIWSEIEHLEYGCGIYTFRKLRT